VEKFGLFIGAEGLFEFRARPAYGAEWDAAALQFRSESAANGASGSEDCDFMNRI
jgi:hypothetical protein